MENAQEKPVLQVITDNLSVEISRLENYYEEIQRKIDLFYPPQERERKEESYNPQCIQDVLQNYVSRIKELNHLFAVLIEQMAKLW